MARAESITCDICGRAKGETNHWLVATSSEGQPAHVAFAPFEGGDYIVTEGLVIEDICGADCSHKRLQRALDAMHAPPATQEA